MRRLWSLIIIIGYRLFNTDLKYLFKLFSLSYFVIVCCFVSIIYYFEYNFNLIKFQPTSRPLIFNEQ